jgi:uncharacterized membrane protein YbjE (DUF340 family)
LKNSLAILAFFALGLLGGLLHLFPTWLRHPDAPYVVLLLLLFLVGFATGGDARTWALLRRFNLRVILVPATVTLGTLCGVALVAPLLHQVTLRDALAVGSGLGYYSLSSILITELDSERLGVIALLANVMRELTTLIIAPLLARTLGGLAPIAAAGATSLDTTLPVITRFSGREYTTIAVFSGAVLTFLVPLLVTMFLGIH